MSLFILQLLSSPRHSPVSSFLEVCLDYVFLTGIGSMDEWPRPSILPSQTDSDRHHHHRSVRPLGDTSGNAQIYPQDFRPGIENQVSVYDVPNVKVPAPAGGQYHFPSAPTLPSNDQNAANIARLNARRQRKEHSHGPRRRFNEVRPYLQCHKYTDYRARRRQDTGEDGKPVWDDPMEEAFQNGLWRRSCTYRS